MKRIAVFLFSMLAACGGTIVDVDGGGTDAASDSTPCEKCVDAASFACGDTFCSGAGAVCIHPCCGGAMICAPLEDGGACPSGLSITQTCPPQEPCGNACTPPPPYCGDVSACSMGTGHDCYLACN